jgi:hypothetical protein
MKFLCEYFSKFCRKTSSFHLRMARITGTLREDQYAFMIISCSFLPRIRNISKKSCREYQNTHFMFNNPFFENFAVYEITWKNTVEPGRPQMTTWPLHIACWVPKTTNTLRICNNYCFSTTTMVSRTGLSITLYVQCVSSCNLDGAYFLCGTNWIFK